jgi:hypothetical protein
MAPWDFHERYPFIDVDNLPGYPNHRLSKWADNCPKHDGDRSLAITYVEKFIRCTTRLKMIHEDVQILLFLCNKPIKIRVWLAKNLKPKIVSSLAHLTKRFLEHWGLEPSNT